MASVRGFAGLDWAPGLDKRWGSRPVAVGLHPVSTQNHDPGDLDHPPCKPDAVLTSTGADIPASHGLRQIYDNHDRPLRAFLSRLLPSEDEISDVAQEVYLRVLRLDSLSRLEPNPRAYILQIAKNLVRDRYRRQKVRGPETPIAGTDAGGIEIISEAPSPEETLDWQQRVAHVKACIADMDADVRRAFLLSRIRNMTYPDIAAEMGISARTVRRYVAEALSFILARAETKK